MNESVVNGRDALASLATRFPQLYVAPEEGAQEAHRRASGRGIAPENANLEHFSCTDADELREVATPAGPVEVLFLQNRADFETFLQIIGHKSQPVPIARTVGAITYRGLADWDKVAAARQAFIAGGGTDWAAEFARLAKEPGAFRSEIVVISEGPYSNIDWQHTPYDSAEWLRLSREIRLHHECAHVVCRRTMPENVLPLWDEVTADTVGLLCATGTYDVELAALFLGVCASGYTGGRLAEYVDEEQTSHLDEIAVDVYGALGRIREACTADDEANPFDFLLRLKASPFIAY